jgi:signal transduction histidine kinase
MSAMGPASRLRAARRSGLAGGIAALRVIGLVALVWAVAREHLSDGSRPVPAPWLATTAAAWLCWLISWARAPSSRLTLVALAVLAGAGGVVAAFAPVGIAFPAIAVLAASMAFQTVPALGVAGVGAVALIVGVLLLGTPRSIIAEGLLAVVAALLGGASRRQYRDRAAQAEALLSERMRADAERDRATALAERNRIGREIHDVLAHSLGVLSVQLEAADAVLETEPTPPRCVRSCSRHVGSLLRACPRHAQPSTPCATNLALTEQLTALAQADGADLSVTGTSRPLPPDAALALYRAAQEALSNAR